MKKLFIILLLVIFNVSSVFGYSQISTTLTEKQQKVIIDKVDEIYLKFKKNLDNLALDKRITTLKTIIDNVDKLSTLNKQLVEKFTVSYLRYLIVESLNTAEKELENEKNIEKEDTTKEEEKIEVPSLFPDRELNQTLFLAGSKDNKILSFRVKADYDNIRLRELVFTGNGLGNLSNFRLLTPTGAQIPATSVTSNKIIFSNINGNNNEVIVRDTTAVYNLIANINNITERKAFNVSLIAGDSSILFSTGRSSSFSGDNVSSDTYTIVKDNATVLKVQNDSKNIVTSALKFSVSAFGKDGITLTKATFNNRFSGYDTTNAKLSVYKNSPTYANLLGSTALGVVTGDVIFTQNNLIDSGYVNTYVVIVEGIVYDSNARNQDWVVSMTDLITDSGIHFGDYANTGDFPLTEVK